MNIPVEHLSLSVLFDCIQNQKEPLIYSYGFGIRSRIFGYYVRLDWGYGINDHIAMPSLKQLSLSLDF